MAAFGDPDWTRPRQARRRLATTLAVLPSVVAGSVVAGSARPQAAAAFAQDPTDCNDRSVEWSFTDDWDPYPAARGWAQEAIGLWNEPLDYNGSALLDIEYEPDPPSRNTTVELRFEPVDDYGEADCTFGSGFWINSRYIADRSFVWHVTKHEMGHLFGAEHSGRRDSYGNIPGTSQSDNPTIMGTCFSRTLFNSAYNYISQDDYAYVNWLHSAATNRQIQANWGYEQGTRFWGIKNLSSNADQLEHVSSGGSSGPGYIRHKNAYGSVIFQTVNLATGDDDEQYRIVGRYKTEDPSAGAGVRMGLYYQALTYPGDNICDYADGLTDLNDPQPSYTPWWTNTNGWIIGSLVVDNTATASSWTGISGQWFNPATQNGYRMQALIGATYQSPSWVDFDNVRMEGT